MDFKNILNKFDSLEKGQLTESKKSAGGMADVLKKLDSIAETKKPKKEVLSEGVAIQADGADAMQLLLRLSGMDIDAANLDSTSGAPAGGFGDPLSNKDVVDTSTAMSTPSPEGPEEVGAVGVTFATGSEEPETSYSDDSEEDEPREEEGDDEYANSPDENEVQDTDDQMDQGDDLNKKKKQYPDAEEGDNPMKAFESEMSALIDEMISEGKIKEEDKEVDETSCATKKKKVKESVDLNKEYNTLLESILSNAGLQRK